jgi:hypothetical protein
MVVSVRRCSFVVRRTDYRRLRRSPAARGPFAERCGETSDARFPLASELLHLKAGNHQKMAGIVSRYSVPQVQRGDADQQVGQCYSNAFSLLFRVDAPRTAGEFRRDWVDGHGADEILRELLSTS